MIFWIFISYFVSHSWGIPMMKITGLSHLFKWENLHNWWLTKYFFAPLYIYKSCGAHIKAPRFWSDFQTRRNFCFSQLTGCRSQKSSILGHKSCSGAWHPFLDQTVDKEHYKSPRGNHISYFSKDTASLWPLKQRRQMIPHGFHPCWFYSELPDCFSSTWRIACEWNISASKSDP